jgi:hypothetical protein
MAVGAIAVVTYNLELFGGVIHNSAGFALAWGGLPALTGYWMKAPAWRPAGVLFALACVVLSVAQRRLSTSARDLRPRVEVSGCHRLTGCSEVELSAGRLAAPLEGHSAPLATALPLVSRARCRLVSELLADHLLRCVVLCNVISKRNLLPCPFCH